MKMQKRPSKNTNTVAGRMVFGSIAEFERNVISELRSP